MYQSAYYQINNSLFVYDPKTKTKILVMNDVYDFKVLDITNQYQGILSVRNDSITLFSEDLFLYKTGTDYYCAKNPQEPRCAPQSQASCYVIDVLVNNPYCNLQSCYGSYPDSTLNCSATCTGTQAQNITCQALACANAYSNLELRPECFERYINHTFETNFVGARRFKLQGDIVIGNEVQTENKGAINKWAAVGITAGSCVVLFTAIFVVGLYCYIKKLNIIRTQLNVNANYTDGK
ncbi:Hypothetical_protein [Hexamita inflata]|uniref:Hypothetical_protein n=1 Tax=Hexamita inflata TaxID=28002 RepID=A0AA86PT68_9EUKA|nr:Hypothetical protein HINF_LOCUS28162 [Hexamita inflata]